MEEKIKELIQKELGVKKESIYFKLPTNEDERFWIDVLDENFDGDLEKGDPILKQYHCRHLQNEPDECDFCPINGEECGSCTVGLKRLRENISNVDGEDDLNIPF